MKHTLALLAAITTVTGSAHAQTFINGSLNGSVDDGATATGWTIASQSPDVTDINTPVTFYHSGNPTDGWSGSAGITPVTNSSDGGTWVSLAGGGANDSAREAISQSVSGFTIGQAYTISWEQTNYGINMGSWVNVSPAYIGVSIDGGVGLLDGTLMQPTATWTEDSVTFTATQQTHLIEFMRLSPADQSNRFSYTSIDGIALSAAVPEPSSTALLGLGSLALLLRRKRA